MFKRLFDSNQRQLNKLKPLVEKINSFEDQMKNLSDEDIKAKTNEWKSELAKLDETQQDKFLDNILFEAYALVKEAADRSLGMRHYDVQLISGIAMHQGKIVEQKTGEGKTLTATLPLYLNCLTGRGVHLVTPNDYLSRHGAGWMGPVYEKLGVSVGAIMQQRAFIYDSEQENNEFKDDYAIHLKEVEKKQSYECDITYGTNHEFGFDYLRDNMVNNFNDTAQTNSNGGWGSHNFAIVDEVDSILIDVARTPLIISTSAAQPTERYHKASQIVGQLIKGTDYDVDEKFRSATLTDLGIRRVERMLGVDNLYEQDFEMVHLIEQSLAAHTLYQKDEDYVVKENKVVIVDQFTGRLLPTNRYSQGLHQAIEAKEGVPIQQESKTLAEISYQNYFRMYKKLAGMTGTAATEAEEFDEIYGLEVLVVPTNKPVARKDHSDVVYKTESAKYKAAADEIAEKYKKGQPVLVGTTSVDKSQLVHEQLKRRNIPHEILNAKNHEREALIIAQAGSKKAVTVSTNMAGRGVDIKLGGDPSTKEEKQEIKDLGGLHVIGTERHEARRIDNQLRGRSGRQGDPGSSRFYVSLQDDLMRIFGGAQVEKLMDRFGMNENIPLEAGLVSRSIETAQKRVEGFNFDRRKRVVEMDDVLNTHREVIYKIRRKILWIGEGDGGAKDWLVKKLIENTDFEQGKIWNSLKEKFGKENWFRIISDLARPVVDLLWMEHLVDMDHIRDGIGLRGYAQKDPIVEYKREGHKRFELLVQKIYHNIADRIEKASSQLVDVEQSAQKVSAQSPMNNLDYKKGDIETGVSEEAATQQQSRRKRGGRSINVPGRNTEGIKVKPVTSSDEPGRNDPCPCGSGKKYKNCGLINASEHKS